MVLLNYFNMNWGIKSADSMRCHVANMAKKPSCQGCLPSTALFSCCSDQIWALQEDCYPHMTDIVADSAGPTALLIFAIFAASQRGPLLYGCGVSD